MPKSNSSDIDNHSLTSDEEDSSPPGPAQPGDGQAAELQGPTPPQPLASSAQQRAVSTPAPLHILEDREALPEERPAVASRVPTGGIARFRAAGKAVIHARSISMPGAGAEPGIDVRKNSAALLYGHIHERCEIEVVDYSEKRANFRQHDNDSFKAWAQSRDFKKPPWAKARWINVGGVSWDIVSEIGLKYDIHPLALEDILHDTKLSRSKADYYRQHLFLRMICHELQDEADCKPIFVGQQRSSSPSRVSSFAAARTNERDDDELVSEKLDESMSSNGGLRKKQGAADVDVEAVSATTTTSRRSRMRSAFGSPEARRKEAQRISLAELKKGERVNVALRNMFILLTRDGTVISFYKTPNLRFTTPIALRLKQADTSLRSSGDPTMLVHGLLDLVVDKALEVMDAYHEKVLKLEHEILLRPKMKTVKFLHILSGDLILHKRTLEPLKQMIYGLRRYDLDRCQALVDDAAAKEEVKGFLSHKSKVYLADVNDHIEHVLSSMDMFSAIAENLINYSFNLNASQTNEIMRRFTIVTITCLPLTLMTGYFGMNFTTFASIQHSEVYFWQYAIPVMVVTVVVVMYSDLERMYHYLQKSLFAKRVEQAYQRLP